MRSGNPAASGLGGGNRGEELAGMEQHALRLAPDAPHFKDKLSVRRRRFLIFPSVRAGRELTQGILFPKTLTMKKTSLPLLLLALSGFAFAGENVPPAGFTAIFNGKDLAGWWGAGTEDPAKYLALAPEALAKKREASLADISKHWSVAEGELINDGNGLYLTTGKNYGDFELWVDYKTVPKADSGIYLRGVPQVQIWDYTDKGKFGIGADKGSGGLWNNSAGAPGKDPLVLADKPFGEWNRFYIKMVGDKVTIRLNDKLVVDDARLENYFDRKGALPKAGPIQLQTHGGEIRWRNIFIRELPAEGK